MLSNQAGYKNVYDLKGGINYGWIDKGLKTIK
jgi:rhodanese-related sulfurtransferase